LSIHEVDADIVRSALRRQWIRIANAVPGLDLERPSRISGWRNAEVLAHLSVQPRLLMRFLDSATEAEPTMRLRDNLTGTHNLSAGIDHAARKSAEAGQLDFADQINMVDTALLRADMSATVTTLQGPIRLSDYLRTRCIEAVVHGQDFQPPVSPDSTAQQIAANALLTVLAPNPTDLAIARSLPQATFIDIATGRIAPPPELSHAMPLMR